MSIHHKINYIEIPSKNLTTTKEFFGQVFGWQFIDYGPEYVAITDSGIDGGFFYSQQVVSQDKGSVLVVIYSDNLTATQAKIESHNGKIVQTIFAFPGGRRFHFTDPNGNEYVVWSDK